MKLATAIRPNFAQHLQQISPAQAVIHVGVGSGNGAMHQWRQWNVMQAWLIDADPANLAWAQELQDSHPDWQVCAATLAAQAGSAVFYHATNPAESGLVAPSNFANIWPNLEALDQSEHDTSTLDSLIPATFGAAAGLWLCIDCLPALSILRGATETLQRVSVLWLRSLLQPLSVPDCSLEELESFLHGHGFRLREVSEGNHPALGEVIFVRDWHALLAPKIINLKKERSTLTANLQTVETSARLAAQIQQAAIEKASQEISQLTLEKQALNNKLLEEEQKQNALSQRQLTMASEFSAIETQRDELKKLLNSQEKTAQALGKEKVDLLANQATLESDKTKLLAKQAALENEMSTLRVNLATLEQKNATLKANQTILEQEKSTVVERQATLVQEKSTLSEGYAKLDQEKAALIVATTELGRENDQLTQTLAQNQKQLTASQQQLQAQQTQHLQALQLVQDNLRQAQQNESELQEKLAQCDLALVHQRDQHEQQIRTYHQRLGELKEQLQASKEELEIALAQIAKAKKKISLLEQENAQLKQAEQDLKTESQQQASLFTQQLQEASTLHRAEQATLAEQARALTDEISRLGHELDQMRESRQEEQTQLQAMQLQLTQLENEKSALQAEKKEQQSALEKCAAQATQQHAQLQQKLDSLSAEIAGQLDRAASEKALMQQLQEQLAQAEQRAEQQQAAIVACETDKTRLTQLLANEQANLTRLNEEKSNLARALETSKGEVTRINDENSHLSKILNSVKEDLLKANTKHEEQRVLATERGVHVSQLLKARDALEGNKLALEQAAKGKDSRLHQLEQELAHASQVQRQLAEEMVRAEAQIDLIKDVLLRESGL